MTSPLTVSRIQAHVRRLPGIYYLASEVSRNLRIPLQTLQMWRFDQRLGIGPSYKTLYRGRWVALYTPKDVRNIQQMRLKRITERPAMQSGGPGRKRMWNEPELADRNRRNNQSCYHMRRATALDAAGARDLAGAHRVKGKALRDSLHAQSQIRRELLQGAIFCDV